MGSWSSREKIVKPEFKKQFSYVKGPEDLDYKYNVAESKSGSGYFTESLSIEEKVDK